MRRLKIFRIGQDKVVPCRSARIPKLVKSTREKIKRNPKRSIQNLAKKSNVSHVTMSIILRKDRKMSPFKHVEKHQFSAKVVDKRLQRCKILFSCIQDGTLSNLVFSNEKKFDIEHNFNAQNYLVWSRNGDEESRLVARTQCPALVMVWAAVPESGKSLLFCWSRVKFNQQNYQDDILVGGLLCAREHLKKRPWSFQHHRSGFQKMFSTSLPKRNGPHLPLIWILWILKSDYSLRAMSLSFTIKVWKS